MRLGENPDASFLSPVLARLETSFRPIKRLQSPLKKWPPCLPRGSGRQLSSWRSLCRHEPAPLLALRPRLPVRFPAPPRAPGGQEIQTRRIPLEAESGE